MPSALTADGCEAREVCACSGSDRSASREDSLTCATRVVPGGPCLRGIDDVQKRYLVTLAGSNLTVLMCAVFRIGTPRSLQGLRATVSFVVSLLALLARRHQPALDDLATTLTAALAYFELHPHIQWWNAETAASSTVR